MKYVTLTITSRAIVKLVRTSLCACGFPTLSTSIALGTTYEIDLDSTQDGTMICGGCGANIAVVLVWVYHDAGKPGFLPLEIFLEEGGPPK